MIGWGVVALRPMRLSAWAVPATPCGPCSGAAEAGRAFGEQQRRPLSRAGVRGRGEHQALTWGQRERLTAIARKLECGVVSRPVLRLRPLAYFAPTDLSDEAEHHAQTTQRRGHFQVAVVAPQHFWPVAASKGDQHRTYQDGERSDKNIFMRSRTRIGVHSDIPRLIGSMISNAIPMKAEAWIRIASCRFNVCDLASA